MSNDDITWLDADTYVTSDGVHHRLSGVDAPEVAHISKGGTLYLGSDVGETEAMKRLQQEGGFTSNVDLGEKTYDREVSDLLNSQGTSLRDTAFIHNIIPPTPDSAANIPTELYQRKLDRESAMKILGIDKSSTELPTVDQKAEEIRQRLETQRVEAGFTRMPQMMVPDPQTYVAIKGATGRQAQQKAVEEIERIKDLMSGQSIYGMPSPAAYQKLEQELRQQQEALMFATLNPNRIVSGSATQPSDRTRDNESRNPITDSLVNSLEDLTYIPGQLAEGLSNYNEDWKALKQWGQSRTWNQKFDQRKRASLPSFADVREEWSNDEFNWKDISTTASALTSTLAGSLPQMALMMMKTPGMIANMAVYTGQYYAEQPENDKSLALALAGAIPSAILDQLGFESMVGAKFLTNKADRDLVVSAYSSKYGVSLKEAEKALEGATKKTLLRLAGWSKDVAQRQIGTFPASAKKIGEAALAEGMTETMQQALEILASHGSLPSPQGIADMRFDKTVTDQLKDAAMGGAGLGGMIKVGTNKLDSMVWSSLKDGLERSTLTQTEGQQLQAHLKNEAQALGNTKEVDVMGGDGIVRRETQLSDDVGSIEYQLEQAALETPGLRTPITDTTFEKLEGAKGGMIQAVKRAMMNPKELLSALGNLTIATIRDARTGRFNLNKARIRSIMLPGTLSGDHFDGFKQRIIQEWDLPTLHTTAAVLKVAPSQVNELLARAWTQAWSKGNDLPPRSITAPDGRDISVPLNHWWQNTKVRTAKVADLLRSRKLNPDNYLLQPEDLFSATAANPKKLRDNKTRIVKALQEAEPNMLQSSAERLVEHLASGAPDQIRSAYKVMHDLGVAGSPAFNDVFSPDIYDGLENLKQHVSNLAATDKYIGRHGEKLAALVHLADAANNGKGEWDSPQERAETIKNLKDWVAITRGEYHSLQDRPGLQKAASWWHTFTMLAFLPKATLSSIAEAAFVTLGAESGAQALATMKKALAQGLKGVADHLQEGVSYANTLTGLSFLARSNPDGRLMNKVDALWDKYNASGTTPKQKEQVMNDILALYKRTTGQSLYRKLGYDESGYNVQTKFELQDMKARRVMKIFARIIGLEAQTNAVRVAGLHMAADIFQTHLMILLNAKQKGVDPATNPTALNQFEAESAKLLTSFGADLTRLLNATERFMKASNDDFDIMMNAFANEDTQTFESKSQAQQGVLNHIWPEIERDVSDNFSTILRNMLDSKAANPQSANMPKFIHDPRLKSLTVMMRFMTAFTANVLPRIYKEYVIDGHKHMRLQALQVAAMALFLGYMASILKDLFSYGDDDNPYLKTFTKKTQRALYNSGLLGNLQGPIDKIYPLYDFDKKYPKDMGTAERVLREAGGAAVDMVPPLAWTGALLGGVRDLATSNGDPDKAVKGLGGVLKAAPMLGGLPAARWFIQDKVKDQLTGE